MTGNKFYYRGGRYIQVSLYLYVYNHPTYSVVFDQGTHQYFWLATSRKLKVSSWQISLRKSKKYMLIINIELYTAILQPGIMQPSETIHGKVKPTVPWAIHQTAIS